MQLLSLFTVKVKEGVSAKFLQTATNSDATLRCVLLSQSGNCQGVMMKAERVQSLYSHIFSDATLSYQRWMRSCDTT